MAVTLAQAVTILVQVALAAAQGKLEGLVFLAVQMGLLAAVVMVVAAREQQQENLRKPMAHFTLAVAEAGL